MVLIPTIASLAGVCVERFPFPTAGRESHESAGETSFRTLEDHSSRCRSRRMRLAFPSLRKTPEQRPIVGRTLPVGLLIEAAQEEPIDYDRPLTQEIPAFEPTD